MVPITDQAADGMVASLPQRAPGYYTIDRDTIMKGAEMDDRHSAAAFSSVHPGFYGRDDELDRLYELFAETARTRVPRLAVLIADSGIGKTALVQAFYRRLTADPDWDNTSPKGFWPDAFQGTGNDLKVNPDFPKDYRPEEPPKFMWLGMRWQNPGNRNPDDQGCPLPGAREMLYRHVKVVQGMPRLWRRFLKRLGKKGADLWKGVAEEGVTYAAEGAANLALGSFAPVVKPVALAFREAYRERGLQHRDLEESTERNAGDELCLELGGLMGGKEPLPTILWLDDAQWIDPSSVEFLGKLFRSAKKEKWPLLVIATHWEREWKKNHHHSSEDAPSFTRLADSLFEGSPQPEVRVLEKGDRESLRSMLLERLPGLTEDQQELIIRKCDGNFLSLEENIRELLGENRNFKDRDPNAPLTQAAMGQIEAWESDRDRRVEQRFRTLEEEIKDILGWSSRAGARFVRKMISDFAQSRMEGDSESWISMCFDPYAIFLGSEDRPVVEFKDRAYYRSAMKYFDVHLRKDHEDALRDFFARWFSDWINNCFDENGNTLRLDEDRHTLLLEDGDYFLLSRAVEVNLLLAAVVEPNPVELLEMAVRFLPLPSAPIWSEPIATASLRAHCMLVEVYAKKKTLGSMPQSRAVTSEG